MKDEKSKAEYMMRNVWIFIAFASLFFLLWGITLEGRMRFSMSAIEKINLSLEEQEEVVSLKEQKPPSEGVVLRLIPVVVTAYNPEASQTDKTPTITASNKKVKEGMIALSRDIEKKYGFKFGDDVFLLGLGRFIFEDRMNKRWTNRVDILMFSEKKAKSFGLQSSFLVVGK